MTETDATSQGEIGLLDILVVIAESWIVILVGTLAAAAVGFVFGNAQPTHYSVEGSVELTALEVQGAIASSSMLEQMQANGALVVSAAPAAATTTVELAENSAEAIESARAELLSAIQGASQASLEIRKARIGAELAQSQQRISELNASLERAYSAMTEMENTNNIAGEAYSQLAVLTQQLEAERYALAVALAGQEAALAQLPSNASTFLTGFTESSSRRSPVIVAIVAGFIGGFVCLILAFIRHGLRAASRDPEGRVKLERIRRAFTFRTAQ